jgi:hypothetical protein
MGVLGDVLQKDGWVLYAFTGLTPFIWYVTTTRFFGDDIHGP